MKPPVKYCAIYTRKSREEGLEQEFNSLDAQREACQAYIMSQKAEGWIAMRELYDDGGFTGGNMDRPALKKLLGDIQTGKVHTVVVYKIDRLTRSLMDFAKLVEVFDKHGVTFVSITQSFNTTTSMGRLTLNVLLSFAQFEREVTGERIRDKIAASKKKGMWMGGSRPTGYDIHEKQLVIKEDEAELVRLIFNKYLEQRCVRRLKGYLDGAGISTKHWTSQKGNTRGGKSFSRGILYKILTNPVYIGKIRHKDILYDGQHQPLLPEELWYQVQKQLAEGTPSLRGRKKPALAGSLLKGILYDGAGNPYSPVFTGKSGKQYRYYVSQALLQNRELPAGIIGRVPSHDMEALVERALIAQFSAPDKAVQLLGLDPTVDYENLMNIVKRYECLPLRTMIPEIISRVIIHSKSIGIVVRRQVLREKIAQALNIALDKTDVETAPEISVPFEPVQTSRSFVIPGQQQDKDIFDLPPNQLRAWIKGIVWRDEHFAGQSMVAIARRENTDERYVRLLVERSLTII